MIAVLPPDCAPELLDGLLAELTGRGWTCQASVGREQTIVTVAGCADAAQLEAAVSSRVVADVLPLHPRATYVRLRRRRQLMHGIAWGLTLLVVLGLGIPLLAFLRSPVESLVAPNTVRAALVDEVPEHSARLVRTDHRPALLVRLDGERFFAVDATCTYLDDCLLEWSPARQQIACPCHGCAYDVYGNVIAGPPSIPLASFPVERYGEEIHLRREL